MVEKTSSFEVLQNILMCKSQMDLAYVQYNNSSSNVDLSNHKENKLEKGSFKISKILYYYFWIW